jgi:hypothetical protein
MDTLLFILLASLTFALVIHSVLPTERPPHIIYVQTEVPQSGGSGCLLLFGIGVLMLAILLWA